MFIVELLEVFFTLINAKSQLAWLITKLTIWCSLDDFGELVVVHVDYEENRVVTINLEDDVVVHVDYPDHRLVTTDLGEDVVVHVDYVKYNV